MMSVGAAGAMASAPAGVVWTKTCQVLKRELGEATFGSWLGQASLRETGDDVCLVAATGGAWGGVGRRGGRVGASHGVPPYRRAVGAERPAGPPARPEVAHGVRLRRGRHPDACRD